MRSGSWKAWVLGAAVVTSPAAALAAKPRIVFDHKVYDFGVLLQGATVQHAYTVKNDGKAPLEIQSVNTSCGCTAALPDPKVLPRGATGRILVTYDSRGKIGEVNKLVRVRSNDPESPVVNLSIRGFVAPSEHMDRTGTRNLFEGSCRECHVDRGVGKTGEALYRADCAMCHEHHRMGGVRIAPAADELSGRAAEELRRDIAQGRDGTSMPGYHKDRGGPLGDAEIDSLVAYIRSLGLAPGTEGK
jgi:mono/diheme cytochrome c family protein